MVTRERRLSSGDELGLDSLLRRAEIDVLGAGVELVGSADYTPSIDLSGEHLGGSYEDGVLIVKEDHSPGFVTVGENGFGLSVLGGSVTVSNNDEGYCVNRVVMSSEPRPGTSIRIVGDDLPSRVQLALPGGVKRRSPIDALRVSTVSGDVTADIQGAYIHALDIRTVTGELAVRMGRESGNLSMATVSGDVRVEGFEKQRCRDTISCRQCLCGRRRV